MTTDGAPPAPAGTVVVPAHDEETLVARCLQALLADAHPGELEVCVVANGCTDRTVAAARGAVPGHPVRVVEIPTASKVAALRRGDSELGGYPRIYLDADVTLDTGSARRLLALLDGCPGPAVAAPRLHVATDGCAAAVRAYYRVWQRLPYVSGGVIGTGVYAVNGPGGARLGPFPDVTNDDGWVRSRFEPAERWTSEGVFTVRAPRTVRAMVRRQARVVAGNRALDADRAGAASSNSPRAVLAAGGDGVSRSDVAAYLAVTLAARALASWRALRRTDRAWATDTTTRTAGVGA